MVTEFTKQGLGGGVGMGYLKNDYGLLNLRAFRISMLNTTQIVQCMGYMFLVEVQKYPLKFQSNYVTHK